MKSPETAIQDALTPVCTAARVSPEILTQDVLLALHRAGYAILARGSPRPVMGTPEDEQIAELGRMIQQAHAHWLAMGAPGAVEDEPVQVKRPPR